MHPPTHTHTHTPTHTNLHLGNPQFLGKWWQLNFHFTETGERPGLMHDLSQKNTCVACCASNPSGSVSSSVSAVSGGKSWWCAGRCACGAFSFPGGLAWLPPVPLPVPCVVSRWPGCERHHPHTCVGLPTSQRRDSQAVEPGPDPLHVWPEHSHVPISSMSVMQKCRTFRINGF